jgi:hypothetical protein
MMRHQVGAVIRSSGARGAVAAGALAIGAYAIGALAIGRLAIRKARIGDLEIDQLIVRNNHSGRSDVAMKTSGVAEEYISLCRRGEFERAMVQFFSADHVRFESIDMTSPPTAIRGINGIKESGRGFTEKHEIHGFKVEGPFVGQGRFAARFAIDATFKPTGRRAILLKLDLYTVRNGTIVSSEVYYNTPPLAKL